MARPDPTPFLLEQSLSDEIEAMKCAPIDAETWRVTGWVRSDEEDWADVIELLESVAEDAVGKRVLVEGPLIDPELNRTVWWKILNAADRPEDVVSIRETAPNTVSVRVRHQATNLGRKRNRLPKLEKALPGWTILVAPLGRQEDIGAVGSLSDAKRFLSPYLGAQEPAISPELIHQFRADTRRQRLTVLIDAPEAGLAALTRAARAARDATDVEVIITHRIAPHRARAHIKAALAGLSWIDGSQVKWSDKLGGPIATVDADPEKRDALNAFFAARSAEIGLEAHWVFDTGRSVMTDRVAGDFPEEGILTGIRHVDEGMYEVEALLPLQEHTVLEAWTDAMEEKWGVSILLSDIRLHAPDLRYARELGADKETIARRYNRPGDFPEAVEAQAVEAEATWDVEAAAADDRREDIRETIVMSIDPARTRDLDDALSIDTLDDGTFEVGVHIADVSPFVSKDSPLDQEALMRGFTTYLTEGEIPVLPERLSNGLLSLHGGQDSPALSLFVRLNDAAEVQSYRIARTLIHNHCRFAYSQAQAVLNGAEHEHADRLHLMNDLAKKLRAERKAAGSLDLNLGSDPEKESHQLIEEFMLLANECVARFLIEEHPENLCLYRTHPHVNQTDWKALNTVAEYMGAETRVREQTSMQAALEELAEDGEESSSFLVFRFHVGRVLEKATYHFEQLGHGALAKLHYAHFTSPIRRYTDLIVHRLIDDALYKEERGGTSSYSREELVPICEHLNHMEIRVGAGSFESHRLNDLRRFDGAGRTEEGIIVGLMRGRIWIKLTTTDLRVSCRYNSDRLTEEAMPVKITDRNTGLTFSLGQQVLVKTQGVDWARKAVEAVIVG